MECCKCGYEIDPDEPVYCYSCFNLVFKNLINAQKEVKRLKDEVKRLKNELELSKRGIRRWKKKRSRSRFR